jgi:hypothetical protein
MSCWSLRPNYVAARLLEHHPDQGPWTEGTITTNLAKIVRSQGGVLMYEENKLVADLAEKTGLDTEQVHRVLSGLGLTDGLKELDRILGSERVEVLGKGRLVLAFRLGGMLVAA